MAINGNMSSLEALYGQAGTLKELLKSGDDKGLRKKLKTYYDNNLVLLEKHIGTTDALIEKVKSATEE